MIFAHSRTTQKIISWAAIVFAPMFTFGLGLALLSTGCTNTVTPKIVAAKQASFDGNVQNSGLLGVDPAGRGFVITAHARDRYNALVDVYGRDYDPTLKKDAGVSPAADGNFVIDREHLAKFDEMNAWRKSGFPPLRN